jgi:probable rRNA maturation factor
VKGTLVLRNRQRARRIDLRLLRRISRTLLEDLLGRRNFNIGISLLGSAAMAHANRDFLGHEGPTDVITFPYSEPQEPCLEGDLLICAEVAEDQAQIFRTTWQEEVVRYVVHGVLHLCGYDDLRPAARRKMKAEEGRLLKRLCKAYPLAKLGAQQGDKRPLTK